MKLIKLAIFLFLFGCAKPNKTAVTTIYGVSKDLIGKTIYLKNNNHFDFLSEHYELDSTVVASDGKFQFKIELNTPNLVKIDIYDNVRPGTFQVFKNTPEHYQYLLCSQFLGSDPTLYLEPGKSYKISNWKKNDNETDVVYDDDNHNLLRKYYVDAAYYDAVRKNRKLRDLKMKLAWQRLNVVKDSLLLKYKLQDDISLDSFEHYLKTEIILGASNWFFNWFDAKDMNDFKSPIYQEALSVYNSEEWNKNSLHYFKLTERLINTKLCYQNEEFKIYFEPSVEKLAAANKYCGENIKAKYSSNIKALMLNQ